MLEESLSNKRLFKHFKCATPRLNYYEPLSDIATFNCWIVKISVINIIERIVHGSYEFFVNGLKMIKYKKIRDVIWVHNGMCDLKFMKF
jgi:hypothetical protein